jgi:hypothetical protein
VDEEQEFDEARCASFVNLPKHSLLNLEGQLAERPDAGL